MSLASIMQLKKIEVPLTEANFRVLLQPLCREGTEGWVLLVVGRLMPKNQAHSENCHAFQWTFQKNCVSLPINNQSVYTERQL